MSILIAICLLVQSPDKDPAHLDIDFLSEITVMPDCRMRHVMVLNIRKGALPPGFTTDVVNTFTEDIKKQAAAQRGQLSSLPMIKLRHDWGESYRWVLFCSDINCYQWISPDPGEYTFEKLDSKHRLVMKGSAFESLLLLPPSIKSAREVIILPGNVTSATGVHAKKDRMAITELTIRDVDKASDGEKVRLATIAPRAIECGSTSMAEAEIRAFNKEYESAMK